MNAELKKATDGVRPSRAQRATTMWRAATCSAAWLSYVAAPEDGRTPAAWRAGWSPHGIPPSGGRVLAKMAHRETSDALEHAIASPATRLREDAMAGQVIQPSEASERRREAGTPCLRVRLRALLRLSLRPLDALPARGQQGENVQRDHQRR